MKPEADKSRRPTKGSMPAPGGAASAPVAAEAQKTVTSYLAGSAKANLFSPRHYVRQHLEAIHGPGHRLIVGSVVELFRRYRADAAKSGRVETFDQARRRLRLSEAELKVQAERFKNAHLALYLIASALMVYLFWLAAHGTGLVSLASVLLLAGSGYVHGYLLGFRAWQIDHRELVSLRQALRTPSTYLVL